MRSTWPSPAISMCGSSRCRTGGAPELVNHRRVPTGAWRADGLAANANEPSDVPSSVAATRLTSSRSTTPSPWLGVRCASSSSLAADGLSHRRDRCFHPKYLMAPPTSTQWSTKAANGCGHSCSWTDGCELDAGLLSTTRGRRCFDAERRPTDVVVSRLRCWHPGGGRRCGCSWLAAGAMAGSPSHSDPARGFTPCADFLPRTACIPYASASQKDVLRDCHPRWRSSSSTRSSWSRMGNAARAGCQPTARVTARSWAYRCTGRRIPEERAVEKGGGGEPKRPRRPRMPEGAYKQTATRERREPEEGERKIRKCAVVPAARR